MGFLDCARDGGQSSVPPGGAKFERQRVHVKYGMGDWETNPMVIWCLGVCYCWIERNASHQQGCRQRGHGALGSGQFIWKKKAN